jgi:hypothetical protein
MVLKHALPLVALAACSVDSAAPPWRLDHDRIVAVRVTPPHLIPGAVGQIDVLVAHASGPTTVEPPRAASAVDAPGGLFTAVHFNIDHWQIDGLDQAALDPARAELGLPADAPVPIEVTVSVAGPLYATKRVWLGDASDNPAAPMFTHGPDLQAGREYPLVYDVPPLWSVRWLTSCGSLRDDETTHATQVIEGPCDGELVLVVRDPVGGVAWLVLPVHAE